MSLQNDMLYEACVVVSSCSRRKGGLVLRYTGANEAQERRRGEIEDTGGWIPEDKVE